MGVTLCWNCTDFMREVTFLDEDSHPLCNSCAWDWGVELYHPCEVCGKAAKQMPDPLSREPKMLTICWRCQQPVPYEESVDIIKRLAEAYRRTDGKAVGQQTRPDDDGDGNVSDQDEGRSSDDASSDQQEDG